MEQSVYALLRTRDMAISRYREFGIPVDWLSDSGVVGQVCLVSTPNWLCTLTEDWYCKSTSNKKVELI